MREHELEVRMHQDDNGGPDGGHEREVVDADEGVGALPDDADRRVGGGGGEGAQHGAEHGEAALRGGGGGLGHQTAATTADPGRRVHDLAGEEQGRARYQEHAG